jgi:hypothetical protein
MIVQNHNSGTGGTHTQQASQYVDSWDTTQANFVIQALSATALQRYAYMAASTRRWWRLVIDDCANTDGYAEIGVAYLGTYDELTDAYSPDYTYKQSQLSTVIQADQGATYTTHRAERRTWALMFPLITPTFKATLAAIQTTVGLGTNFFISLDPTDATQLYYVYLPQDMEFSHVATSSGSKWNVSLNINEAL